MPSKATAKRDASNYSSDGTNQYGDPEPDPEPPAAPPIIILSESGKAPAAPHPQPHQTTSSQISSTTSRYNLRSAEAHQPTVFGEEPDPDPVPPAPPVIILSTKRSALSSPPRPDSPIQPTSSEPSKHYPTIDPSHTEHTGSDFTHPTQHNHTMGSKASKLAPSHGKLQPSVEKQDKAEMAEPSNYYTHRSKSMRRKAGKTGATSGTGGAGGGAGGGVGGAV